MTLTWFMPEWMTCFDCIVSVDRMSELVYLFVYLLWTLRCISNLPCIAQTARGVGTSFCRHELWDRLSHNPSKSFEAGRVVRRRKQHFRVLVWHARKHFIIINELWELARRISIFIPWGVKEVHSIKKKGLG